MLYANVKSSIADDGKECGAPLFTSLLYGVGQSQSPQQSGHKKCRVCRVASSRGRTRRGHGRFVCPRPTTRVIPEDVAFYCVEFETQSLLSCIVIQVNSKLFLILKLHSDVAQSQFICVIHSAMGCKDMMLLSDCATKEEMGRGMMCLKSSSELL